MVPALHGNYDIIKYNGGEAANFMDTGAATPTRVAAAKLIYKDPDVKGILINILEE